MAEVTEYFSFQGKVYTGKRNSNGSRAPSRWVYDNSQLDIALTKDQDTKNESWSGSRARAATLATGRSMQVALTLGQINNDNLALATDGVKVDVAAGSVADETIGTVAAGDVVALDYVLISNLALTKTGATALVEDTDYTLDATLGLLTFLTAATGVTGDFDYGAHSPISLLEGDNSEYYLIFIGINTVTGTNKLMRAELNRIAWNPAETLPLINESFGELQLTGEALIDPVRQGDNKFGPFGRLIAVDPS